jgi:phosphoadenosine phosphosulfate reductase
MILNEIKTLLSGLSIVDQLRKLADLYPGKVVFTTSFGMEDQVISHLIFENNIPVDVVTLDTGRLFKETYSVFEATVERYQKKIKVYFPDHEAVGKLMTEKGPFSFYYSKENRIECCRIRKVNLLDRVMEGMSCWISGIRASQSENRSLMDWLENDEARKLFKFYPLFEWSFEEVENFIRYNNIPYNVLHDRGFVSIGCEPCTRAVIEGEDFRSGRWWWETDSKKECGFHIK